MGQGPASPAWMRPGSHLTRSRPGRLSHSKAKQRSPRELHSARHSCSDVASSTGSPLYALVRSTLSYTHWSSAVATSNQVTALGDACHDNSWPWLRDGQNFHSFRLETWLNRFVCRCPAMNNCYFPPVSVQHERHNRVLNSIHN